MVMHPYYDQFLAWDAKWQNLSILFLWLTTALIPVTYLSQSKKPSFWSFILLLWWWLWFFFAAYVGIKSELLGAAVFKSLINASFIFALWVTFIIQLVVFGQRIVKRFLKINFSGPIMTFLMTLAIWLVGFLVTEYVLLLLNIAFPLINRLLRAWWIYLIRLQKEWLSMLWDWLMESLFYQWHQSTWIRRTPVLSILWSIIVLVFAWVLSGSKLSSWWTWIMAIIWWVRFLRSVYTIIINEELHRKITDNLFSLQWLADVALFLVLLLVVWYFYNGVVLSFIPYPTAWDANHAYMFVPKMFALHNGYYRNEISMRGFGWLWLPYITFRFSLFSFSNWFLGVSSDTIAIEMNFLSWLFVIIFGIWLVWMVVSVLRNIYNDEDQENNIVFNRLLVIFGALFVLLRNTSGMWAFLVFIDNKTDMWVLTMVIVALLTWFAFLRTYLERKKEEKEHTSDIIHWLLLSWSFFAFAVLAKPTAMFDVLNFFLLLRWLWFGIFGVLALPLLVVGLLALIKMRWIQDYFDHTNGQLLATVWWVWFGLDVVRQWYKKLMHYGKYLVIRVWCFLFVLVGMKLFYYIPDTLFYGNDNKWVKEWVNVLLLSKSDKNKESVLLTQVGNLPPPATCSLWSEWLTEAKDLYKELKPIIWNGYDEDVGRYIGYGWKWNPGDRARGVTPFVNSWWAMWFDPGCYSFSPFFLDSHDAVTLCRTEEDWKSFDRTRLESVKQQVRPWWAAFWLLDELINASGTTNSNELKVTYREQTLALDGIMQGESMKIVSQATQDGSVVKEIYLPYKYLNFFNISFNRSLQNLSSYYTDIWIVWLVLIFTTVLWLLYAFISNDRFLIIIHVVTIFGWILWLFLWWWILWYGIWIIVWTILCIVSLVYSLSRRVESSFHYVLVCLFVSWLVLIGIWQLSYNLLRIATQWWWWAFMRYKTSNGIDQNVVITPDWQITQAGKLTWAFGYKNVFALQFPHYNKFLNLVNTRKDDEWALIAGTYARYFVNNQAKIVNDQFLTEMWHWFSDNNVCRSYLRLQDKWLKYFAIDPNIWTVVQGDGNKWLFERFYARLNPTNWTIEQHGTMTMIAALVQKWYIRYVSSNNIWAKYALILPDQAFGWLSGDALIVARAKMMIARFFQDQQLLSSIMSIADQRIKDGSFYGDIADIIWLTVSEQTVQKIMRWEQLNPTDLTEDEKKVLIQFFGLRQQAAAADKSQYQQSLQNFVMQSLWAWNQVIVFELVQ